ncbi:MAG: roadblock/LC7 domain-containing protein, partial [Actinomycetes bacterium]
ASPTSDIGLVGYEMTMLVDRVGEHLSPELRTAGPAAAWPSN